METPLRCPDCGSMEVPEPPVNTEVSMQCDNCGADGFVVYECMVRLGDLPDEIIDTILRR